MAGRQGRGDVMTSWFISTCGETGVSFFVIQLALCVLSVLFGVVCLSESMSKSQLKAKHLEGERNEAHYRQCVPPCKRYMSADDTHSLCVVCLERGKQKSAHEGVSRELVDVVTRAVAKLNINWLVECHVEPQRDKLDERFLWFKTHLHLNVCV